MRTIRWHPLEDAIFYPKNHQLIKRSLSVSSSGCSLGPPQVIASFSGHTIGMSYGNDYRIAGGDGNDVNAGRFLISLVRSGVTKYVVYDFAEDKIVSQNFSGSGYDEPKYPVSSFGSHMFTLPNIDYAQVSASGLYIVANVVDGSTEQIELYDFSGNRYDVDAGITTKPYIFNTNAHTDVALAEIAINSSSLGGGVIRDAILVKITAANLGDSNGQIGSALGDMNVVYWYRVTGSPVLQWGTMTLLEWQSGAVNLGGDQHSVVPGYQTPQPNIFLPYSVPDDFSFRALTSMREIDPADLPYPCVTPTGGEPWKVYFGEIVELSLTYRDLQPRRIVHHRITTINPTGTGDQVLLQPEAWFSPDGQKVFFKSPDIATSALADENLYFIDLPARTCEPLRISSGGSYRLANTSLLTPESIRIYPNPVSHGRSMWIAGITEEAAFAAELHLIGLDGRSHATWQGELQAGQAEKIPLTDFASGMYIAEVRDASNGAIRFRKKVVIR